MATKVAKSDFKKMFEAEDIRFGALFAELIGVFILTSTVLAASSNNTVNALIAVLAYLIMWLVINQLSGAHMNPAITLGLLSVKQITPIKAVGYIIAQLIGAMLAIVVITQLMVSNPALGGQVFEITKLADSSWLPVLGELLGALIFGFAIGSVVLGKKQGFEAAFTAAGGLLLGLLLASMGSSSILNPAVAIGVNAFTSGWSFVVYALAPIVGVMLGIWGYKALQWEVAKGKK